MKRCLLILVAPVLLAQTVDSYGEAAAGIRVDDPLRNALAIEIIRRDHLMQLAPDLRRIVAEHADSQDGADVQQLALDAMIGLGETMTPAEIQPFAERCPTFALILAARATGDTTPLLLDLLTRAQRYEAYVATANLLLPRSSPEFARRVMSSLRTMLQVVVMDCTPCDAGVGGGWGGSSFGNSSREKAAWPMVGHYVLTSDAKELPLAPGIDSIYYRRVESHEYSDYGFLGGGEGGARNRNVRNLEYVATMAGIAPAAFPIQDREYTKIMWRDSADFVRAVSDLQQRHQSDYAAVVQSMVARGLLSAADTATLKLNITLNILDLRNDRTTPLPAVE